MGKKLAAVWVCVFVMGAATAANAALYRMAVKIQGPAYGFVIDRGTSTPLSEVSVTVLPQDEVCKEKSAATDKDGAYNLTASLGKMTAKMGIMRSSNIMKAKPFTLYARFEKPGYKPVEGAVEAYAMWMNPKKYKGRVFLPEVFLAPEGSDKESVILNNAYFVMTDVSVEPAHVTQGESVVVSVFINVPKDPFIREGFRPYARNLGSEKASLYLHDDGRDGDATAGDNIYSATIRTSRKFVMGANKYLLTIQTPMDITLVFPGMDEVSAVYRANNYKSRDLTGYYTHTELETKTMKPTEDTEFSFNMYADAAAAAAGKEKAAAMAPVSPTPTADATPPAPEPAASEPPPPAPRETPKAAPVAEDTPVEPEVAADAPEPAAPEPAAPVAEDRPVEPEAKEAAPVSLKPHVEQSVCLRYEDGCIDPTSKIKQGDFDAIYSEVTVNNVSGDHTLGFHWISPTGDVEATVAEDTFAFEGGDTFKIKMNCSGDRADRKAKLGTWRIDTLIDGKIANSYSFKLVK